MQTLHILNMILTIVLVGTNVVILFLLWSHLQLMQEIAAKLNLWAEPAQMVSPGLPPGTTWAPSDGELAVLERRMTEDSRKRAGAQGGLKPSKRTWDRKAV